MAKDTSSKPKKEKRRGRIKETFAELKKVTWPSFATVVKQTGIVLAVVAIFLVVLIGFDALLGWLYDLMVKGLNSGLESASLLSSVKGVGGAGIKWLM